MSPSEKAIDAETAAYRIANPVAVYSHPEKYLSIRVLHPLSIRV
jgi:hypothetical protein